MQQLPLRQCWSIFNRLAVNCLPNIPTTAKFRENLNLCDGFFSYNIHTPNTIFNPHIKIHFSLHFGLYSTQIGPLIAKISITAHFDIIAFLLGQNPEHPQIHRLNSSYTAFGSKWNRPVQGDRFQSFVSNDRRTEIRISPRTDDGLLNVKYKTPSSSAVVGKPLTNTDLRFRYGRQRLFVWRCNLQNQALTLCRTKSPKNEAEKEERRIRQKKHCKGMEEKNCRNGKQARRIAEKWVVQN